MVEARCTVSLDLHLANLMTNVHSVAIATYPAQGHSFAHSLPMYDSTWTVCCLLWPFGIAKKILYIRDTLEAWQFRF